MKDLDDDLAIEFDEPAPERETGRGALLKERRAQLGLVLVVAGLAFVLVAYLQVRTISNVAAQIPYVVSGGLVGVLLAALGGAALFSAGGTRLTGQDREDLRFLAAQVEELAATTRWTADGIEQIAGYLNEQAGSRASAG